MGVYLTKPIKDKNSHDCENAYVRCGVSSMQGWRVSQEDAHNCCVNFDEFNSLFAVYDGHGGHEVAQYASQEYPELLKRLKSYQRGDYANALKESFLEFDASLKEPSVVEILKHIASGRRADCDFNVDASGISAGNSGVFNIPDSSSLICEENFALDRDKSPDNSVKSSDPLASSSDSITPHTSESMNDLAQRLSNAVTATEADNQESSANPIEEELSRERHSVPYICTKPGVDSGCTAVVALVTREKIYVANAGDSRAVICKNGDAFELSTDHKPEDNAELSRITAAGGHVSNDGRVNGGLNLSRALGDHQYKASKNLGPAQQMITASPEIQENAITPEDEFLVLACDGIWNSLSSQNVVDFIRPLVQKKEKLSKICEMLLDFCLAPDTSGDGTGCDNMTCIIIQFLPALIRNQQANMSNFNLKAFGKNQTAGSNRAKLQRPGPMIDN